MTGGAELGLLVVLPETYRSHAAQHHPPSRTAITTIRFVDVGQHSLLYDKIPSDWSEGPAPIRRHLVCMCSLASAVASHHVIGGPIARGSGTAVSRLKPSQMCCTVPARSPTSRMDCCSPQ